MAVGEGIADEGDRIDDRMRHDERSYASGPNEEYRENGAHNHIADATTEALVKMVGAPQQGAGRYGPWKTPGQAAQPFHEIAYHDYFLKESILDRGKDQDRNSPPHERKGLRDDRSIDAQRARAKIESKSRNTDSSGESNSPSKIKTRLWPAEAEKFRVVISREQVQGKQGGNGAEEYLDELEGEVQIRTPRSPRWI